MSTTVDSEFCACDCCRRWRVAVREMAIAGVGGSMRIQRGEDPERVAEDTMAVLSPEIVDELVALDELLLQDPVGRH